MRILVIYNSRSAHRRINFKSYRRALIAAGADVETRVIGRKFRIHDLLKDAQTFDRVVVAGGDGTISAVAGILQGTNKPILVYPGGTANILAQNLRIPAKLEELAALTLNGKPTATDICELEYMRFTRKEAFQRRFLRRKIPGTPDKIYFAVMAGIGFAAGLMKGAQEWKPRVGQFAYWLSALWNLFPRRAAFNLKLDGREVLTEGIGVLLINFEKIQFDLKVVSKCRADDGKLTVMVVKARSLFGLIPVMWGAIREKFGLSRPRLPEIMQIFHASEVEVSAHPRLRTQFDGEYWKKTAWFKARVLPGAAQFIYGADAAAGG